jgi:hypothetical protein
MAVQSIGTSDPGVVSGAQGYGLRWLNELVFNVLDAQLILL